MGIWELGATNPLLGSAVVTTTGALLDGFRYVASPAINLIANKTYVIAGASHTGDAVMQMNFGYTTFSTASQITYGSPRFRGGGAFTLPDQVTATGPYFGPNFQFVLTAVPEPGTVLFGLGVIGFVATRRRKRA